MFEVGLQTSNSRSIVLMNVSLMRGKIVVVGGGIAGMLCALMLKNDRNEVVIIERDKELGGLFKSQNVYKEDIYFDYGTRFLSETDIPELEKLLYGDLDVYRFDYVSSGTFYNTLFSENSLLSDESLSEEDKKKCLADLMQTSPKDSYSNLENQFEHTFGKSYSEILLKPIVKKIFHVDSYELEPDSHLLFSLKRIVIYTEEHTKELKKESRFDAVVGFHNRKDGINAVKVIYPLKGGIGAWVESLENKLKAKGVEIWTNCNISAIEQTNNKIDKLSTSYGELSVDELVWTIPTFQLIRLLNLPTEKTAPPKLLTFVMFHFIIDKRYLSDLAFVQCFDLNCETFRVTLYNNYRPREDGLYLLTSEVLLENVEQFTDKLKERIFQEIIYMKLIPEDSQIVFSHYNLYPNSFPVPTTEFSQAMKNQNDLVKDKFDNLRLFGKSNSKSFFMDDVLRDIYYQLKGETNVI